MSNAFLIAWDLDEQGTDDVREAVGPEATVRTDGGFVSAHRHDRRGSVAVRDRGSESMFLFGSGVPNAGEAMQGADNLLDDCDDDLVGALVGPGGVTLASGRGSHQLVHAVRPGGGHVVGTSVHDVARALGSDLRVDRSYEDFALGFGFHPEGRTPYRGVRVLPAGVRFRSTTDGLVEIGAVASRSESGGPPPSSFDVAVDELFERFMGAVERQAGSLRSHAVLLGGFDSALVATCLRKLGHEIETFTFGFGDPRYEQRNAETFARSIGANHRTVPIDPRAVMHRLVEFDHHFSGIGAQPHYQIHTLIACEAIAERGYDHVFTGDGCDSIFLGYPTVSARAGLTARLDSVPRPVARLAERALAMRSVERHLGHVARTGRSFLHNVGLAMPERGHLPTRYIDEWTLDRLRPDHPVQEESVEAIRRRLAAPMAQLDPVRLAFHGNGLNRQSQAKVDGAVRSSGVIQHSPYRDPAVRDFVARLPTAFLRPDGVPARDSGKAVLVEMVRRRGLLPPEIIDMPKQSPSDSPIDTWYAGVLRSDVMELLGDLPFDVNRGAIADVLRPKLAERVYRERASISHHALQVIGLLTSYAAFTGAVGEGSARGVGR